MAWANFAMASGSTPSHLPTTYKPGICMALTFSVRLKSHSAATQSTNPSTDARRIMRRTSETALVCNSSDAALNHLSTVWLANLDQPPSDRARETRAIHALLLLSDDAILQSQAMYLSNREGYLIAKFMQVTPPKETPTAAKHLCTPKESKSSARSSARTSTSTGSFEDDSYPRVLYLKNRNPGKARINSSIVGSQMCRSVNNELEKTTNGACEFSHPSIRHEIAPVVGLLTWLRPCNGLGFW